MALTETGPLLLRRPLPPVKKKPSKYSLDAPKKEVKETKSKVNDGAIEVYNSLERETTRQKTDEFDLQKAKMTEYRKRLELLFSYGKPRGGDPFPFRLPKKATEINYNAFIEDSYEPPPPIFTLDDFMRKSQKEDIVLSQISGSGCKEIIPANGAKIVEKPLSLWHIYTDKASDNPIKTFTKYQKILLDQNVNLPEVAERKPVRQQLIEEKAFFLERYAYEYGEKIQAAIRERSMVWPTIIRPEYITDDGKQFPSEGTFYEEYNYEDVDSERSLLENHRRESSLRKDTSSVPRDAERYVDTEFVDGELVLVNSPPLYFQGDRAARSPSPFEFADLQSVFSAELAVLECTVHGGTKLSLKAHFLDSLPDISQLYSSLTHVNLSFNHFMRIPTELFQLTQIETLKMRNNPIYEIPRDIKKLKKLKNLVFSFCCISSLPPSLFKLPCLESLDLSYNRISFVPEDINKLRQLQVLNFEGNQLTSFPRSILQMSLRTLNVINNFTNSLFWKTTAPPQPQQLLECCATFVAQTGQHFDVDSQDLKLNAYLKSLSICDFCGGPKFGQGVRVIKPAAELFGVKNLPILFNVCSQTCRTTLRTSTELSMSPDLAD